MKLPNVLCTAFLLATPLSAAAELAAVTVIDPLGPGTSEELFTVVVPDLLPALVVVTEGPARCTVRWPTTAATMVLESTDNLGAGQWDTVAADPVLADDQYSVTLEAVVGNRFFRLRYQP